MLPYPNIPKSRYPCPARGTDASSLSSSAYSRARLPLASVLLAPLELMLFEPAHFIMQRIMQRKMLLEIRERAERLQ